MAQPAFALLLSQPQPPPTPRLPSPGVPARRPRAARLSLRAATRWRAPSALAPARERASRGAYGGPCTATACEAEARSLSGSSPRMPVAYPTLDGKNLVSVSDCIAAYEQNAAGIVFVDGSWYHRSKRSGRADFEAGPRIRSARYCDMDDICAKGKENPNNLPQMLPTKHLFATAMDEFGISNNHRVIVYGRDGCIFTPRTWFLFQQCGHAQDRLHLMQGSLEEFASMGGPIDTSRTRVPWAEDMDLDRAATYIARNPPNIVTKSDVLRELEIGPLNSSVILDSRGTSFASGHLPGAINIPYRSIVTAQDLLKFRTRNHLQELLRSTDLDAIGAEGMLILSCGSGVSVCHLWLALEECGRDNANTFVYDGSWAEWGIDDSTPKEFSR